MRGSKERERERERESRKEGTIEVWGKEARQRDVRERRKRER